MICPLSFARTGPVANCLSIECAWWDQELECCAILRRIKLQLEPQGIEYSSREAEPLKNYATFRRELTDVF